MRLSSSNLMKALVEEAQSCMTKMEQPRQRSSLHSCQAKIADESLSIYDERMIAPVGTLSLRIGEKNCVILSKGIGVGTDATKIIPIIEEEQ